MKLIMLSGGSESVAMLIKYLKETNEPIFTLHVHYENIENRARAERIATEKTLAYCRTIRNFYHKDTYYSVSFTNISYDLITLAFCGAHYLQGLNNFQNKDKSILFGVTKTEWKEYYSHLNIQSEEDFMNTPRARSIQHVLNSYFLDQTLPKLEFPFVMNETEEILHYIPEELKPWIISCRRPMYRGDEYFPCGECCTCKKMERIKNEHIH